MCPKAPESLYGPRNRLSVDPAGRPQSGCLNPASMHRDAQLLRPTLRALQRLHGTVSGQGAAHLPPSPGGLSHRQLTLTARPPWLARWVTHRGLGVCVSDGGAGGVRLKLVLFSLLCPHKNTGSDTLYPGLWFNQALNPPPNRSRLHLLRRYRQPQGPRCDPKLDRSPRHHHYHWGQHPKHQSGCHPCRHH